MAWKIVNTSLSVDEIQSLFLLGGRCRFLPAVMCNRGLTSVTNIEQRRSLSLFLYIDDGFVVRFGSDSRRTRYRGYESRM